MKHNPFVSELTALSTEDLIRLANVLSGGYWLGRARRELNLRSAWDYDLIKRSVSPFAWGVISGERRGTSYVSPFAWGVVSGERGTWKGGE